jgi:hypothetical protein
MLASNRTIRKAAVAVLAALPFIGCDGKPEQTGSVGPPPADVKQKQEDAIKNAMSKGKVAAPAPAPATKPEEKAPPPENKKEQ